METPTIDWPFERAWEAHKEWERENPNVISPTSPLFVWIALQDIEKLRKRFESGDQFALMSAIRDCACHEIVMPKWVADAYIRGFDGVLNYRVATWDDAFGRPNPKNTNLRAKRKGSMLRFAVPLAIEEILEKDPGRSINSELFEEVGRQLSIGKTQAQEYYYSQKNKHNP